MSGRNYGYGNYSSNYDRDRGGGRDRDRDNFKPRGYQPYGNRGGEYNRDRGGRGDDRYGHGRGFSRGGSTTGDNSYTRRDNFYGGGRYQNQNNSAAAESRGLGYGGSGWSSGPRTSNNNIYSASFDPYGASTSTSTSSASSYDMWVRRSGSGPVGPGPGPESNSTGVKTETFVKPVIPKDIEEQVLQAVSDVKMEGIFDKIRNQCLNDSARTNNYMNVEDKVKSKTDEYLKRVPWTKHLQQRIIRDRLKSYLMETKFFKDCMDRLVQDSLSDLVKDSARPIFTKAIEQFLGFERSKKSNEGSTTSDSSENKSIKKDDESFGSPSSSMNLFPPLPTSPIQPMSIPPPSSELPLLLFTSKILNEYDNIGADKEKNLNDHYILQQQEEIKKKEENQVPLISSSEKNEPVDCLSLAIDMEISDYEDDDVEESNGNANKVNEFDDPKKIKLEQEAEKRKIDSRYDDDDDDVNITPPYSPVEYVIQEKEEEIIEEHEEIDEKVQEIKQEEGFEQQQEMQEKEEIEQKQEMKEKEDPKDSIIEPILYLDPLPSLRAKLKFFARFKKNDTFEHYNVRNISFEDDEVVEEK